jgi:oligoribonuclease NrnB/cAMP/cGMP phosphodiesterase (DHH superfamily)|tara:strand:- start:258 stop:1196 length:939 start_codon:yes stop_codon:yes gene_type:complete
MIEPTSVNCVIYHADCTDGFGAAYAAWKCLGKRAEYHACKHGTAPPNIKGKVVAILDFSFDNATTKEMIAAAKDLIIIDHHKSAIVELHDITNTLFDMTHSGARLAWDFFHPGKEAPKFIDYIEDRDIWKWELPYSKEFSAAFDMVPFEFEEFEKFEDDSVFDDAVKRGSYILAYAKTVVKKICEKASSRKFEGQDVLVVNASHWMSEIGARLAPDCDFAIIWYYDHQDNFIKVSIRSFHDKVDASEIAKKFGGGGHRKAAGFQLPGDAHLDEIFDVEKSVTRKKSTAKGKDTGGRPKPNRKAPSKSQAPKG